MFRGQTTNRAVAVAFQVGLAALGLQFHFLQRPRVDHTAVGQQYLQLQYVIQRLTVDN